MSKIGQEPTDFQGWIDLLKQIGMSINLDTLIASKMLRELNKWADLGDSISVCKKGNKTLYINYGIEGYVMKLSEQTEFAF